MLKPSVYATHSCASDPGEHAALLREVAPEPAALHQATTGVLVHYRGTNPAATPEQLLDIDSRRVSTILDLAQQRTDPTVPLVRRTPDAADATDPASLVGGCCRDFSLLATAILREHGVPARTRIGFAGYFPSPDPRFHHDHVVVERWDAHAGRWVRFDPEIAAADHPFDVTDIPVEPEVDAPFRTASQVWTGWRRGDLDAALFGVSPELPRLCGPPVLQCYVLLELAHLMKVETLLWDGWGPMATVGGDAALGSEGLSPELIALTDRVADLILRAAPTHGRPEEDAVAQLRDLWNGEAGVRPGRYVQTWSPAGRVGRSDLEAGTTEWTAAQGPLAGAASG